MKKTICLLLFVHALLAQNVPFIMDHAVYHFLDRHESFGHIQKEEWSTRPYTYNQINDKLNEIASHSSSLSDNDLAILKRFQNEFNRDFSSDGIRFPWSKETIEGIRHPNNQQIKPFFMTYKHGNAKGWINWSETFRIQLNGKSSRGYYTDHLGIYGEKGSISFTTQFTYERVTKNDDFTDLPESYKEGYILERDYIDWINWDYPKSSLVYMKKDFTFGIHRQPVYWGYSKANSPILSDNVYPLPHIQWTTEVKHLRYKFLHARLSPNSSPLKDTLNVRRNLSAHRVEFDINPNFEFAFNEMIVYAYRDFELGYLNPVNFLFTEEHVQGNLDNLLMALEYKWTIKPGLTSYGTWFFDELDFFKLFSGWWGNKFIFQIGVNYHPQRNLPSLNFEYTAARPWTYSHKFPVNSYTSAGRVLGLEAGPNTQSLKLSSTWQPGQNLLISCSMDYYQQGQDLGANVFTSYDDRTDADMDNDGFLLGSIDENTRINLALNYYVHKLLVINFYWDTDTYMQLGMQFDL